MPIKLIRNFLKKRALQAIGRRAKRMSHVKSFELHRTTDGFEKILWRVTPFSSQNLMAIMTGKGKLRSGDAAKRLFHLEDAVLTAHYGRKGVEGFTYAPRGGEFSRSHLKQVEELARLLK